MGRWLGPALAGLLLLSSFAGGLQVTAQASGGSSSPDLAGVFAALVQAQGALVQGGSASAQEQVATARERFDEATASLRANQTRPAAQALDHVDELAGREEANGSGFRTAVVAFEARVLSLAADAFQAHLDAEETPEARAWLTAVAGHLEGPGRVLPPAVENATADPYAHEHSLEAALDGLLAMRVLEEVGAAEVLALQDLPRADIHAERAGVLWEQLGSRLAPLVAAPAASHLNETLPELASQLDQVQAGGGNLAPTTGPLTAIAYHRSIDRLEGITATIEAPLALVYRTLPGDRLHAERLGGAAEAHYRNHRANYLQHGEGGIEASDAAFDALREALAEEESAWAGAIREAVDQAHQVSNLDHGMRFIVRDGRLDADTTTEVPLGWTNSGLEGVASYRIVLGYDPAQVNITGVETGWPAENATVEREPGRVVLAGQADEAAFGRTLVASLAVTPRVANGSIGIEVLEHAFETPDGSPAVIAGVEAGQLFVGDAKPTTSDATGDQGHHDGDAHDHGEHDHGDGAAEPTSVQDAGGGSEGGLGGGLGLAAGGLAGLSAAAALVLWRRRS